MPMAVPQRLAPLALRLLYRLPKPTHWALASLLFKASINHFFAGCFLFSHTCRRQKQSCWIHVLRKFPA